MQPGDVIAQRYRLVRLLGEGGMGQVWSATHTVTMRQVALKFLRPREDNPLAALDARSPAETAKRRVLREARAACAVAHPAVVAVHDVCEAEDGSPVLVMDLLEGESLRARLEREGKLSLVETVRIVKTVLGALEVAHAAGIVHRDLKPDNLFLADVKSGASTSREVRILDFGVAKLVGHEGPLASSGTLTATGAMVGTPYYMAPEQAFGEEVDGRADLWAVGVLMFECLVGEPPTKGENLGQVLRMLTTGNLPALLDRAPGLPEEASLVVGKLLAVDAIERYQTAREALLAMDALDDAAPTQREARARVLSERVKVASVTPSRAITGKSEAPLRAPVEPITADGNMTAPTTTRPRDGRRNLVLVAAGAAVLVLGGLGASFFVGGAHATLVVDGARAPAASAPSIDESNRASVPGPDAPAPTAAIEPPVATAAASARATSVPAKRPAPPVASAAPSASAGDSNKLLNQVPF